jgi:hypothetical protein
VECAFVVDWTGISRTKLGWALTWLAPVLEFLVRDNLATCKLAEPLSAPVDAKQFFCSSTVAEPAANFSMPQLGRHQPIGEQRSRTPPLLFSGTD